MAADQLVYLYKKCIEGIATAEEQATLLNWLQKPENEEAARQLLKQSFLDNKAIEQVPEQLTQSVLQAIWNAHKENNALNNEVPMSGAASRVYTLPKTWLRYAAAVLLVTGGAAAYLLYNGSNGKVSTNLTHNTSSTTIAPGGNRATLTLADGSIILLDSAANGQLASQGNISILKLDDGAISYNGAGTNGSSNNLYNTISTPKGGQYQVTLPDGSKVLLNAASTMRFATNFAKERRVFISGEAFFEVEKNSHSPFLVVVNDDLQVEVLGTSFNVMAYNDEPGITTTLLEGSVRINKGASKKILRPGEQAEVADAITVIKDADVNKAIAWKNGLLNFEGVGLREMMRQLQRWYDIEVIYSGQVPDVSFFGKISRKVDLSTVLEALAGFGLHYKMEGRKLIVMAQPGPKE